MQLTRIEIIDLFCGPNSTLGYDLNEIILEIAGVLSLRQGGGFFLILLE